MKKVLFVLLVLLVLFPTSVWAQEAPKETPLGVIKLPDFLKWTKTHPGISGINLLINNLVKMIFIIASVGLFFMFLYGGLRYITSGGDKAQTEAARNILTYALIGFAIVALSFAIMRVIEAFFGISITGPPAKYQCQLSRCVTVPNARRCTEDYLYCEAKQDSAGNWWCCPPGGSP